MKKRNKIQYLPRVIHIRIDEYTYRYLKDLNLSCSVSEFVRALLVKQLVIFNQKDKDGS